MSSMTSIMGVAKTGLTAAQAAIAVTSENITNVNTAGYSRRTVSFAEAYVDDSVRGQVGSGVWANEVQRNFSQYIENQYYDQASLRDRWESLYTNLSNTESLFNESSGYGLSKTLSNFFKSWEDLVQSTDNASSRGNVIENSQTLISTLRELNEDIITQQQQAEAAIIQQVSEVNDLLKQISELNKKISNTLADTNALQDTRAQLVRELSGYMDINYIDNGRGDITITTQSGQALVDGFNYYSISYDAPQATADIKSTSSFDGQVYFSGSDNQEYTLEVVQGGSVTSGTGAALFRVSVDGGRTWLKDDDGNELHVSARNEDTAAEVGALSIWFGTSSDSDVAPTTNLSVGDKFCIVPTRALYWNENTSIKENITPYTDSSGVLDSSRLTGGTLSALCTYKNDYLGAYREKLDAVAETVVWEVNRLHSQGAGLENITDVYGTYSAKHDDMALGSNSAGLAFGDKLTAGSAFMYVYNSTTGLQITTGLQSNGGALDFGGGANFDPSVHTLEDVRDAINNTYGTYMTASIVNHQLTISANDGYSFNMGTDSTGLYAALGLNTYFTGSSCSDIGLNTAVTTDTDRLCAGHVNSAGQANQGDGTTATAISDLLDKKVTINTLREGTVSETLSSFYSGLVSQVGADTAQSKYKYTYTEALASDLDDQQQAISGVNIDEEMTNLIKYQHAYTAAAKLITTADEMMQVLLSLKS
ncbi:flagellar hook-associated protein 1 FlgK [Humidesulfovibrio mexicanus]|jgi:flagellar hook-associated protein 1 FlgK|uniref:Flagellar hook-associated protein 1 n=1 Tax=Humidesulfovibrio mexicanus TaxID=147047 RepID=A0A238Y062_9BACT|nr:flagellar hook-associated protein FlgK [Humidesulfovibrio mexicanus]SNR64342.1 flagellar hook-associated protein 1 FlgK [Humidesulfovibrio mexicanus]